MIATLGSICSAFASVRNGTIRPKSAMAALLFLLPLLGAHGFAQTTVISGTVYDPRTTTGSLSLPNVLVYVTTGTVAPLPSGVQCLTTSDPTGVVGFTYSAADGTFTIANVPVNATYTVVIQAGKWRRQFSETVAAVPLAGLVLHMPSDHTQGDIPMIAIATGSVDAVECVLLDMGISPTEFTDDNGTLNLGGRIHLYRGTASPGAQINASTPSQTALMTSLTTMNGYDMVMFPCQGTPNGQTTPAGETNLVGYANAGGRIFSTHYSYAWLNPASPYDSQFPAVANWTTAEEQATNGVGTINTSFNSSATLAQWLENAGATVTGTGNQIDISTLRTDVSSVIAPTQSWVTLNSGSYFGQTGNPVMQMTFNTPVGAAASGQCGRVMYNDYHIYDASSAGSSYNTALPSGQTFSECSQQPHTMTPQEEMLEYALFDLSSFVTPVVVPTLSVTFNPSPLIVKQGDTADQVTINVTNTSATTQIYSSVVLTLTLPTGLTATALSDPTGGWTCNVGTLTCTRATSLAASASDSVILTVSVPPYGPGSTTTGLINVTASSPNFSNNVTTSDSVIFQQPPAITWPTPANIVYGTALSAAQLDASSPVAGSFSYTPAAGTVLSVGPHTLTVTFTPTDTTDYTSSTATVNLTVIPITPTLGLTSNVNPVFLLNAVTFTATIASNATPPTGTMVFYDGATQIGTGTVTAGVASFTTTALTAAPHSITAAYSGDSNYGPATSGVLSETVVDFTVAPVGSGTVSAAASGMASFALVVTPVGGPVLPGTMTLKVAGLSVGSTATFSPSTVTAGSGSTPVTLQVQLPGKAALERSARPFAGGTLPLAFCLILLPFSARLRRASRRWKSLVVVALVSAALAVGLNGCGGKSSLKAQSYTLTVTAASGALSHETTLTLTVQ
jgi:Bacterial Ig-like domain (group 3)